MRRERIGPWLAQKAVIQGLKVRRPVVFDVGAHFGNVAEYYLRMFPEGRVYCFEPEQRGFEKLQVRFGKDKRVHLYCLALSSQRYELPQPLYVGGQSGEMSSLLPRPLYTDRRYWRHELDEIQDAWVDSIDNFCDENHIVAIHALKLDTQGTELDILKGASNLLTAGKICVIYTETLFVEMYEGNPLLRDIWNYLEQFGYMLFDIYNPLQSLVNRQLKVADALFVSPQVRAYLATFPEEWLPKSRFDALGEPSL